MSNKITTTSKGLIMKILLTIIILLLLPILSAAEITLTPEKWETINRINRTWNHKIQSKPDQIHYNKPDHWTFPYDLQGDCEDYAIAKQRALVSVGIPSYMALCRTQRGIMHIVLVVKTDMGDFVLDCWHDNAINFAELKYKWYKIEGANGWYAILS